MQAIIDRIQRRDVIVRLVPGWESRGRTWARVPVGIIDHHDASTRKSGEWGALGIITSGRSDVPGPLSQFQVARAVDGVPKVAVVTAGRANHAGPGGPASFGPITVPLDQGNSWVYGAEKANDGVSEPYTAAAHYATDVLFVAVLEVIG
jgi:hypothetical protein